MSAIHDCVRHSCCGQIVRVLEPNVVRLEKAGAVTLAGSYTPKRLPSCFTYDPAAALRRALPKGTAVELTTLPGKGSQQLAWIYRVKDGVLVQSALVEGGWAQASKGSDASDPRSTELRAKQSDAKLKKLGLWQDCEELAATAAASPTRVDLDTQFEPLSNEFEFGRAAPAAVSTIAAASGALPKCVTRVSNFGHSLAPLTNVRVLRAAARATL